MVFVTMGQEKSTQSLYIYGASSLSFDSDGRDENVDLVQRKMTLLLLKLSHSKSFEVSFLETHLVQ